MAGTTTHHADNLQAKHDPGEPKEQMQPGPEGHRIGRLREYPCHRRDQLDGEFRAADECSQHPGELTAEEKISGQPAEEDAARSRGIVSEIERTQQKPIPENSRPGDQENMSEQDDAVTDDRVRRGERGSIAKTNNAIGAKVPRMAEAPAKLSRMALEIWRNDKVEPRNCASIPFKRALPCK